MTHSLRFVLRHQDFAMVKDFENIVKENNEFLGLYNLQIRPGRMISGRADIQPFFYFPEKSGRDIKGYQISIETGSHVDVNDTLEALHWFYFTLAFKSYFKRALEGFNVFYQESTSDKELSEDEMRAAILLWDTR